VGCDKLRDLPPSVAVEDSEEADVIIAWDGIVGDVGIFHVLPPALHFADCVLQGFVFFPSLLFGGDWFIQKVVTHYKYGLASGVIESMLRPFLRATMLRGISRMKSNVGIYKLI
jgi:hypothetical protein